MATVSSPKVKLLCSFGGKILPRPSDNKLRYAGGDTRIITLRRSATISDFFAKIAQICDVDIAAVKFQLPGEDLDSLISISCQEDLDNLLEEFDRFSDTSVDGSARIRVFVFEKSEGGGLDLNSEASDASSIYYEAVNGVGIKRKNSVVSNISSNLSNDEYPSKSDIGCSVDENLWLAGSKMNVSGVSGDKVNNCGPNVESFDISNTNSNNNVNGNSGSSFVYNSTSNKSVYPPPLTQLPPLYPMPYTAYYVPPPSHFQQQTINLKDCHVYQKALPHAHSDTSINKHLNVKVACNGDNGGNGLTIEPRSALLNCQSEDRTRVQASNRPDTEYGRAAIHSNGENSCYAPASHVPVVPNSNKLLTQQQENNETMTKSKPSVTNTSIAQVQLQGNNEIMAKSEAPVATNAIKQQAIICANNGKFETSEQVQAFDVSIAINTSRHQTQLQVNDGTMEALEHAQSTLNMARQQTPIQGTFAKETSEHTQSMDVPIATSTNRPQAQDQISNGIVLSSERAEASPVPIVVCTTKALAPVDTNNGSAETTDVHASIALNENGSQALAPTNNSPVEASEYPQASHMPIARNMTRPLSLIHVNSGATENIEHAQDLNAPIATNTPRQQAQVQIKTEGMTKSRLKADEVQNENSFDACRYTQDVAHMHKTQAQMKDQSAQNRSHSHIPDPFQTLSQNMVSSLNYMANQDVATTSVQNVIFQVTESPSRVYVPEIPHSYVRPTNNAIQEIHSSTFETPIVDELPRLVALANNRVVPMLNPEDFTSITDGNCAMFHATPVNHLLHYPLNLKHEYSPMVVTDPDQSFRSQAGGISSSSENTSSYIFLNGNYYRKIDHMPPPSTDVTHLRSLQPSGTHHGSTMSGNHEPFIPINRNTKTQPEVSRANATPVYFTANGMPVQVTSNVPIQYSNAMPVPICGNVPIQYSHGHGMNGHTQLLNGPTPSNPTAYTLDPQKNLSSMQMVPPLLNKVPSREFVPSLDLYTQNHLSNDINCNAAVFIEDCGSQHVQNSTNPVQFIQGENHNIQVQTITEQMTRVHEPPLPTAPMNFLNDGKEPKLSLAEESMLVDVSKLAQNETAVVDDLKTEGIPKQVDKLNVGFPVTENLGRLQIIKNNDLEELRELGSGTYGTVYHGKWKGSDVAIKRINERCFVGQSSGEECMKSECWNEACNLADLHHPNIVAFYGVVLDGPDGSFATVTEFMVNGSLKRALLKNEKILDQRKRLLIAMDVAFGMEYLHSKNMIHFDLKSDNLLVNLRDPQRPICKIADLGLSKVKRQTLISGGMRGTLPWMAPELLNGDTSLVSNKVDVFSFGIVMWELMTGQEPYHDMHYGAVLGGIVSNTLRPQVPESCDPEWRSLMEQCWSQEPSERPTFIEISSRLRSMAISLPQK